MKRKISAILLALSFVNLTGANEEVEYPSLANPEEFEKALNAANPYGFGLEKSYQVLDVLTVDTRDEKECVKVVTELSKRSQLEEDEREICRHVPGKPYYSFIRQGRAGSTDGMTVTYSKLSEKEQLLARQTRNFLVPTIAMMGVLYALPRDFTGWEEFVPNEMMDRFIENTNTKPEVDTNHPAVNFIGHPYSGAIYYVTARHAGFGKAESFGYSVFMSTVFWEYGIEAFEEVPSIQDLFITPIFGSILGELMFSAKERIQRNNNQILGSRGLGRVGMAIVDPAGSILEYSDRLFGKGQFIKETEGYLRLAPDFDNNSAKVNWGIEIKF